MQTEYYEVQVTYDTKEDKEEFYSSCIEERLKCNGVSISATLMDTDGEMMDTW